MGVDSTFFGLLRIHRSKWFLNEPLEHNRLANGEVYSASLGSALWRGEVTGFKAHYADAQEVEARIDRLQRPGEFFTAYDPRFNGPRLDQSGAILGDSSPVIVTLGADNKSLAISGLPAGYAISSGDYVGWSYSSNPFRRALHRASAGAVADGTGTTPLFEVAPHIRPGVVTGTAVSLVRPIIKARLLAADYGAAVRVFTEGVRFSFIQSLR